MSDARKSRKPQVGTDAYAAVGTLTIGYFVIQVAANLTVLKTTNIFGLSPIPIGSLLYPLTFTWIDLVNQRLGKRRARWLVFISVSANVFLVGWFQLYIALPGSNTWTSVPSNQAAIESVLGSIPRVLAASVLTNFVVENTDISVYHFVRTRWMNIPIFLRSALSNTVSAPLDGALFAFLAFAGTVPLPFVMSVAATSALYKLAVGYLSVPLVFFVRDGRWRSGGSRQKELAIEA